MLIFILLAKILLPKFLQTKSNLFSYLEKKMMKNILSQEFSRLFQVEIFNKPSNAICFSVPFIPGYLKISYSNKIKYTNICDFYQILEYYKIENPESPGSGKKNEFIKRSYRFRRIRFSRSTIVD